MNNEIKIFENKEFGKIRVQKINNEPWFVAKDVCEALALTNTTMVINRLDEDEVTKLNLGRQGETNFVNEYGLYNLILASRKKEAKEFKRWVTHEVLPSIRKHGTYMAEGVIEEVLSNPDTIIKLATSLKEERIQKMKLEQIIKENRPKVLFADSVEASETSMLVGELARIMKQNGYDIGQNRLFEWLRANKYLISRKGTDYNTPTQKSMNLGLFETKLTTCSNSNGRIRTNKTPKVTGKGQIYFINKIKEVKQV